MKDNVIEKYRQVGKITKKALELSKTLVKPGASYSEIVEKVEGYILNKGVKLAFPTNVSVNEVAAHDTADINDIRVLKKGDIVKIDTGAMVDGYIADSAYTIEVGTNENKELIKSSEQALKAVADIIKPGIKISELGKVIENTIKSFGFLPIANLSGHVLEQNILHSGIVVPNYDNKSNIILKHGTAVAIEPFATNGAGKVVDGKNAFIFRFLQSKPTRLIGARKMINYISKNFPNAPFAKRCVKQFRPVNMNIRALVKAGALHNYSVLREINNGLVSQHEHTFIVLDKPIITTM